MIKVCAQSSAASWSASFANCTRAASSSGFFSGSATVNGSFGTESKTQMRAYADHHQQASPARCYRPRGAASRSSSSTALARCEKGRVVCGSAARASAARTSASNAAAALLQQRVPFARGTCERPERLDKRYHGRDTRDAAGHRCRDHPAAPCFIDGGARVRSHNVLSSVCADHTNGSRCGAEDVILTTRCCVLPSWVAVIL